MNELDNIIVLLKKIYDNIGEGGGGTGDITKREVKTLIEQAVISLKGGEDVNLTLKQLEDEIQSLIYTLYNNNSEEEELGDIVKLKQTIEEIGKTIKDTNKQITELNTAIHNLPDGQAVSVQVVKNTIKVSDLDNKVKEFLSNIDEDGMYICNEKGEVLLRLDVLDTNVPIGESLKSSIVQIVEQYASTLSDTVENGFYICNERGESIATFINGEWQFAHNAIEEINDGYICKRGDMSIDDEWVLTTNSIINDRRYMFSADFEGDFSSLTIGHGDNNEYVAAWLEIDNTNVTVHTMYSTESTNVKPHGLTITKNIQISIIKRNYDTAEVQVSSCGNVFKFNFGMISCGKVYAKTQTAMKNVSFSFACYKIKNGIVLFGDSYFSMSAERWAYYLKENNFTSLVLNGHPGEHSLTAYNDFINILKFAKPKKVIWCMGMNDVDGSNAVSSRWNDNYKKVKKECDEKGIELILATIPTVSGGFSPDSDIPAAMRIHKFKNAIIRDSGYRFIDFEKAVGASQVNGTWYGGLLSSDGVHPTERGAKVLYHRAIADVPELTI